MEGEGENKKKREKPRRRSERENIQIHKKDSDVRGDVTIYENKYMSNSKIQNINNMVRDLSSVIIIYLF